MKQFEYKYDVEEYPFFMKDNQDPDEHPNAQFERYLNKLGMEGWELVAVEHVWCPSSYGVQTSRDIPRGYMKFRCTFKREREQAYR